MQPLKAQLGNVGGLGEERELSCLAGVGCGGETHVIEPLLAASLAGSSGRLNDGGVASICEESMKK